jgi:hypothetical protein
MGSALGRLLIETKLLGMKKLRQGDLKILRQRHEDSTRARANGLTVTDLDGDGNAVDQPKPSKPADDDLPEDWGK